MLAGTPIYPVCFVPTWCIKGSCGTVDSIWYRDTSKHQRFSWRQVHHQAWSQFKHRYFKMCWRGSKESCSEDFISNRTINLIKDSWYIKRLLWDPVCNCKQQWSSP